MAYLTAADFRTATLAEYCSQLALTTAEASDTALGNAITRLSARFDELTNDHYEPENLTLDLTGDGSSRLFLPKRTTAVTTVSLRSVAAYTVQTPTTYVLRSSLYATGSKTLDDLDWLDTVPDSGGLSGLPIDNYGPFAWPCSPSCVRVAGTFGWTTTPFDAKRAVALMVYDHFKPLRADLRRATKWSTADVAVEAASSDPTGIPEVDDIIKSLHRDDFLGLG